MITFDVRSSGVQEAIAKIKAIAPKQIPFILAISLTETARDVEFVVKRAIQTDVDRPRPFTINSVFSTRASKTKLEASVQWRQFADKGGTPGGKYLRPIAEGGSRGLKRSESMLKRIGLLPAGFFLTPGQDAPLDANGNVPQSVVIQMLSGLRAFAEQGYAANRNTAKERRRFFKDVDKWGEEKAFELRKKRRDKKPPWFVVKPGEKSNLAPGVYQRIRTGRKLIFAIVRAPKYNVTFPFAGITRRAGLQRFPVQFGKAMVKALSTAKK